MPNTFIKIASVTVGSGGASSIDFTSIPGTYTDLCLKVSLRSNYAGSADNVWIAFNGSTSSFSLKLVYGDGAAAGSFSASNNSNVIQFSSAGSTSNTFGNGEIYIPNYAGSNNKSFSADSVNENNATTAYQSLYAGLWSNTAAINQITLTSGNLGNFVQYTTATLYGINKS